MALITHSREIDKQKKRFVKMTRKGFDRLMCKTYPDMFAERKLPCSQTCMCWGFDIGPGWYYYLDKLCQDLTEIKRLTGMGVVFQQIKEKYASACFYHRIQFGESILLNSREQSYWYDIIHEMVYAYQEKCYYTCSVCGKSIDSEDKIIIGRWHHDECEECLIKYKPEYKKEIQAIKKEKELREKINDILNKKSNNELKNIIRELKGKRGH